jgi:hypothetical protein
MFQQTVKSDIGAGIVGELAFDSAIRATPATLNTPGENGEANNVIGRAFTYQPNPNGVLEPMPVRAGGTGTFAGILGSPKAYANYGVLGDALGANPTLPNGAIVELFEETAGIFVDLGSAAVTAGNLVIYNTTTGELAPLAAGQPLPEGYAVVPGAVVVRYNVPADTGIAVIALNGPQPVGEPGAPGGG